ncbi:unnamed protein product [Prorocentrum cordatum]|nr:unnamed protein product [Polarella glacialis]|mmetsp:Transcript_78266/g.204016  ORF Transcript_78266/g.204016 Transcript_78266/m.204016 type:complete len:111 (+) Transcript_78266:161-493(+)
MCECGCCDPTCCAVCKAHNCEKYSDVFRVKGHKGMFLRGHAKFLPEDAITPSTLTLPRHHSITQAEAEQWVAAHSGKGAKLQQENHSASHAQPSQLLHAKPRLSSADEGA